MGIKDFFKSHSTTESINTTEYAPLILNDSIKGVNNITESFKGEVEKKDIKYPVELGEEHPFDFSVVEGLYKKFGFLTAVIDKYVDFVVGPGFYVECSDERAKKIIEDFMQDVNFDTLLRQWTKEALLKGNGFLELGGGKNESIKGMKVLNANYMYIKRDKLGVIESYNQYKGGFKNFDREKVISFKPYQIAHVGFNKIGDMVYGLGVAYPALVTINNLLQNQKDLHMLMNRKANSPYVIKLGGVFGGKYYKPAPESFSSYGKDLEWLNNKHEWVVDGLTDIKALNFGEIGDKFNAVLEFDMQMLIYIFQVPAVLMGEAKVPEGLAKVQMDAFERRVQSIQAELEKVIETNIFRRILESNGLSVHVEFQWGRPSTSEKYERLAKLVEILKLPTTSSALSKLVEADIVKMLDYNEDEYNQMMQNEEEERKKEEERPQPIVPGQNETPPQTPQVSQTQFISPSFQLHELDDVCPHCYEGIENYNTIEEWLGFNYKDYIKKISEFIREDKFEKLAAQSLTEELAGKLSKNQILELKKILDRNIKKGGSIKDIEKEISQKVSPKDLLAVENGKTLRDEKGNPKIIKPKEIRSILIARSEVTRVANEGAIRHYKDEGIKHIRWVASIGERTCPQCESLNGQIFPIDDHPDIPLHTMCRCTVVPVTELK